MSNPNSKQIIVYLHGNVVGKACFIRRTVVEDFHDEIPHNSN